MKNEIDRLYLIDRYLKGELTGLALDEFRTKMRLEPEFAEEVESHRAIVEGIKLTRKEHLISVLKGLVPPDSQKPEVVMRSEESVTPAPKEEEAAKESGKQDSVTEKTPISKVPENFENTYKVKEDKGINGSVPRNRAFSRICDQKD